MKQKSSKFEPIKEQKKVKEVMKKRVDEMLKVRAMTSTPCTPKADVDDTFEKHQRTVVEGCMMELGIFDDSSD